MSRFQSFEDSNSVACIYTIEELFGGKTIEVGVPCNILKININENTVCNIVYEEKKSAIEISLANRGQTNDDIDVESMSVDEFLTRVFNPAGSIINKEIPKYKKRTSVSEEE